METLYIHCWWECKIYTVILEKFGSFLKSQTSTIWLSKFSSKSLTKMKYMSTQTFMWLLTALLFVIAKDWKQFKCPPADKRINTMWYVRMIGYYSLDDEKGWTTDRYNKMNDFTNIILTERSWLHYTLNGSVCLKFLEKAKLYSWKFFNGCLDLDVEAEIDSRWVLGSF